MDRVEISLQNLAARLSALLEPVAAAVERLNTEVRRQLGLLGVADSWDRTIVAALWALLLFLIIRSLGGWLRLIALVAALLVLAKVYGLLPGG